MTRLDTVRALAFPRLAGTAGERRAADLVARRLADAGLDVRRERFRAGAAAIGVWRAALFGGTGAAVALAGATASARPGAAAALSLALLALLAVSGRWTPLIESLFDVGEQIESENVWARRAARRDPKSEGVAADAAGAVPAGVPPHVVVLAHYDSKSSTWPTLVPATVLLVAAAWSVGLGVWCALAAGDVAPPPPARGALAGALALAAALGAMAFARAGNASPGAMDNASGVAVLLDCARALPADSALVGADLTFLATGAEEIGLAGAMRWIQSHAAEYPRGRTLFINLDSVGVGRGLLASGARGPAARLVRASARAERIDLRALPPLVGAGVDTMPIAARGFAAVTLLGQVLGSASRRMHTPLDTDEHVTEAALDDAARLVRGIVRAAAGATCVAAATAAPDR